MSYLLESLNCDISTNLIVVPNFNGAVFNPDNTDIPSNLKIVIGNIDAPNTFEINWAAFNLAFNVLKKSQKSEVLLIEAIRNFIKKTNISELNEALNDEIITEEEYDDEISRNPNKYVITLNNITSQEDAIIISELVQKIGFDLRELSTSEVSEFFSVKENQLLSYINTIKSQLL